MDDELRSTERFSDRVEDYVRYRPSYPVEVIRTLEREASVAPDRTRVVDLGCGTGISAACFLREGYTVTGVEPNADMRAAAEATLVGSPRFRIVAAQAFHWFDAPAARSEMRRLLVDDGVLALLWNERRTDASAFLRAYDSILRRYATDYARVAQTYRSDADIAGFFGPAGCARRVFPFHQDFDLAALTGRAMSSSYVPKPGQSGHDGLVRALTDAFERHSVGHMVRFEYDTRLYFGRLS